MTVNQFKRKIDIARRFGKAILEDGDVLVCHDNCDWAIYHDDGNCLANVHDPMQFAKWICQ